MNFYVLFCVILSFYAQITSGLISLPCPNRTHFFILFCYQILQEGHKFVLARRGQAVVAHHQVRLRGAYRRGLRGFFAQQFAHSDTKVLGEELNFLNGWDAAAILYLAQ